MLIDGGFDDKAMYNYAGIAAFGTNEFELAKEWLQKADDGKDARSARSGEDLKSSTNMKNCGRKNKKSARPKPRPMTCRAYV